MGMGTVTEEELDAGLYFVPDDALCVNCTMRKSKHTDDMVCLFAPTHYEAMTLERYWRWVGGQDNWRDAP